MPRLPEVLDKNALPADKQHIHDYLASTRGAVRLPFSAVLNNPELSWLDFNNRVLFEAVNRTSEVKMIRFMKHRASHVRRGVVNMSANSKAINVESSCKENIRL